MIVLEQLSTLIDRFADNLDEYKKSNYDESNTRADFIDKFFELLGWDVYNKQGYSEDFREVVREDKVYIAGKPKSPDYSFRIGSQKQFFVEAKKPSVNIYADAAPAFQLRRYAYTANLPISILTDFEELAIYDTSIKPNVNDKSSTARIFYCKFDEYLKHWEFFNNTFSREAVLKGKLKNYAKSDTKKKGTQSIDRELLLLIENWRNELARNIALRNNNLGIYNLNEAVQKTIDRIIFLRIAEDRNTEIYGQLQTFANQKDIYSILVKLFDSANKKYNSGLFKPLSWLDKIIIDDKVLKAIISDLYYPNPYEFSVLPIEILGHIYEQFLGKTIRLTASHQAKIEEKPEVRKAGGVYYTPSYIVDYIVLNTVGNKIQGKSPDKITSLTVLDPACGSGSFLVGAFKFLLDWHLTYWTDPKNLKKGLKEGHIYQVETNTFRLTFRTKKSILLNNIFGVDIDSQAVEVTKLSLLLTLMEGEIVEASSELFFKNNKEALLPDLESNIKCGNSLIDSSFYDGQDLTLFDEHQQRKINTFDWDREFKKIFDNGGFDCVIGNPPYVVIEGEFRDNSQINFYKNIYQSASYKIDLYHLFFEKSIFLLNEDGLVGFITPSNFISNNYLENLRKYLLDNSFIEKLNVLKGKVFHGASVDTTITILRKSKNKKNSIFLNSEWNQETLNPIIKEKFDQNNFYKNKGYIFISKQKSKKFIKDIFLLGDNYYVKFGMQLRNRKIFKSDVISNHDKSNITKYHRPCYTGKDVNRWLITYNDLLAYFNDEAKRGGCWNKDIHDANPKIVIRQIGEYPICGLDELGYCCLNTVFMIVPKDKQMIYNIKYILAILNSFYIKYFWKNNFSDMRTTFPKIKGSYLEQLPIPKLDLSKAEDKAQHDKLVGLVEQMLQAQKALQATQSDSEKKFAKQKVELLDKQIDKVVYELYGLSEAEIKVVEG